MRPSKVMIVAFAAVGVAACGGGSSPTSTQPPDLFDPAQFNTANVSWLAANQNATGTPVSGGTLKLEGATDYSALLDPGGEYDTSGVTMERAFTRQLITYPASTNEVTAENLVPDIARSMPTVSADGLTYTFTLRSGVMWNTVPARAVTSQDFVIGLKRLCDPALAPLGNPGYYIATITGMSTFCNGLNPSDGSTSTWTAAQRKAYIMGNSISGVTTPDSSTLVVHLIQPTVDFLNLAAEDFVSAVPVEELSFVPETPGNPLFSDGPYELTGCNTANTASANNCTGYDVGHTLTFDRNPQWQQSTDPVRHQYVSAIDVKVDLSPSAAESQVQQDIEAGTADLQESTVVPTASLQGLTTPTHNPQFGAFPAAGVTNPFLVFNVHSTHNSNALQNVKVRQALEYAIDKVALGKIYGGASYNQPLNQVLGPGAEGYVQFNDYATPNNQGDPAKCKSLLQAAGVSNLTLTDYYRASGKHPAIFQEVQHDFAACGVTVTGTPITQGYYSTKGIVATSTSQLSTEAWDMTEPGWGPDWFGPSNARSILPDLFDGQTNFPGTDYGGYDNPATDALVASAEKATSLSAAASIWHRADQQIMADAPFIPFQTQLTNLFRSARVHNAIFNPQAEGYDVTELWLSS